MLNALKHIPKKPRKTLKKKTMNQKKSQKPRKPQHIMTSALQYFKLVTQLSHNHTH